MNTYTQTEKQMIETAKAVKLQAALPKIDLNKVPVMSTDRGITRKEQARLARQLCSKLGLKGISFTAPSYSMAQAVHVRMPERNDHTAFHGNGETVDVQFDPAAIANNVADKQLEAILNKAFPNHNDKSDTTTDYFDYCWSFR